MSFGLKAFKRQRDDAKTKAERRHISQVILGADLSAVLTLMRLKKSAGPEQLRLITPRLLSKASLAASYAAGPSLYRDPAEVLSLGHDFPHLKSLSYSAEAVFAKEGQWHRFGSRAKPMELLAGEKFFLPPRQEVELASFFDPADWEQLDDVLNAYQHVRVLEKLEKQTPTDLANRDEWWMLFHDLGEVTCSELWCSLPSRQVLKASGQGQTLPPEAGAWFNSIKRQAAIALAWECQREIYPEPATLFVPQSMTHEWGHFIVDVAPWEEASNAHPVRALILLHAEEPTSEEMADKIKLLKRVFERVFPGFEANAQNERILASEDYFEWPAEPRLADALLVAVPSLHVIGQLAPQGSQHFLVRALNSVR